MSQSFVLRVFLWVSTRVPLHFLTVLNYRQSNVSVHIYADNVQIYAKVSPVPNVFQWCWPVNWPVWSRGSSGWGYSWICWGWLTCRQTVGCSSPECWTELWKVAAGQRQKRRGNGSTFGSVVHILSEYGVKSGIYSLFTPSATTRSIKRNLKTPRCTNVWNV